jgi:hypothetical protein
VQKQKAQARDVVSCYEAGPTGFWLHRQLTALGVRNYVICPTRLAPATREPAARIKPLDGSGAQGAPPRRMPGDRGSPARDRSGTSGPPRVPAAAAPGTWPSRK